MNNIYKTNFERIRSANQGIFDALERAFQAHGMDYYLIGAQSRDVWIDHLGLKTRTTLDIDFCIYIQSWEKWDLLRRHLVEKEGFSRDKKEPYRFYLSGAMADLIPFGDIEEKDGIIFSDPPLELSVFGCKEVTEDAIIIDGQYKVISLCGLVILKWIAYGENPGNRTKDLQDCLFLLENYHQIAGEELFEGQHDDLIEGNWDIILASARMLGRNMCPILNKNLQMKSKVLDTIKRQLQGHSKIHIDQMYAQDPRDKILLRFKLIAEMMRGIAD